MSNEQIYLSYKNKVSSSYYSKETWNRVMPDLVSKEKNVFVICQNSVPGGPTHMCRHTHSQIHTRLKSHICTYICKHITFSPHSGETIVFNLSSPCIYLHFNSICIYSQALYAYFVSFETFNKQYHNLYILLKFFLEQYFVFEII